MTFTKVAICAALFLFCVAGVVIATNSKSGIIEASQAPQGVNVVNHLTAVRIDVVSVSNGLATFNVVNISGEPLTAFAIHSGKFGAFVDASPWGRKIDSGEKHGISLTLDGAQPLTVDAVVYQSGRAEGDRISIEKIENTRKGYRIASGMILGAAANEQSIANLRAAISALPITEGALQPASVYFGANDARNYVLHVLTDVESLRDQAQADGKMRELMNWLKAKAR